MSADETVLLALHARNWAGSWLRCAARAVPCAENLCSGCQRAAKLRSESLLGIALADDRTVSGRASECCLRREQSTGHILFWVGRRWGVEDRERRTNLVARFRFSARRFDWRYQCRVVRPERDLRGHRRSRFARFDLLR